MRSYPHMCRMDHEEIGFRTESETCPLCQSMAGCDQLNRENADLRARVSELEKEIDARPHRETWLSLKEELASVHSENHALRGMVANLLNERP